MLYKIVSGVVSIFINLIFRIKVENIENFPESGAAVIAFNHKSNWDAPLCSSVLPRKLFYMAKAELFKAPVLKNIIKWSGAFPVNRGTADINAVKTALSILKRGDLLGIFPEGTRVKGDGDHEAKMGAATFAAKVGVPLIPVAIKGKYGLWSKLTIIVGEPIYVRGENGEKATKEDIQNYTQKLIDTLLEMAGE